MTETEKTINEIRLRIEYLEGKINQYHELLSCISYPTTNEGEILKYNVTMDAIQRREKDRAGLIEYLGELEKKQQDGQIL